MFVKIAQGRFDQAPARERPGLLFYTLVLLFTFLPVFLAVIALVTCVALTTLVVATLILTVWLVAALVSERARLI